MIVDVKGVVRTSQVKYSRILASVYDYPLIIEVATLALSSNPPKLGQLYDITTRTGNVYKFAYIGISKDPISEEQHTTQYLFAPEYYYKLKMGMFQRGAVVEGVGFDNYLPYSNQLNYFLLKMRFDGLIFTEDKIAHITEHLGLPPHLPTQPSKIRKIERPPHQFKRYSLLNDEVSKIGWTPPSLLTSEELDKLGGLDVQLMPRWELEFNDWKDGKIGERVQFGDKAYCLMEDNRFYLKEKTARIIVLGELL